MILKKYFYIDWIVENELAIGLSPQKRENIELLNNNNIKYILSLCHQDESKHHKDLQSFFQVENVVLPDHRSESNVKKEELMAVINKLESLVKLGPVFIHCHAGKERSPLVCIGYMMKKYNLSIEESLDYVMSKHKGTNPLGIQLQVLKKLNYS